MEKLLYTYALIEAFYNKGEDYIDSFWPFALSVMPADGTSVTPEEIQSAILITYGADIPLHALSVIMTRAKHKDFVRQDRRTYILTDDGVARKTTMEPARDVQRRINALVEHARTYLREREGTPMASQQVEVLLFAFVKRNILLLERFLSKDGIHSPVLSSPALERRNEIALLKYFMEVERSEPTIFDTLRDVICGSMLAVVLHRDDPPDSTRAFNRTSVYIDTNTLLCILGLDHEEISKPIMELYNLMKSTGSFTFRVFDFTVEETTELLSRYPSKGNVYLPGMKVASVYSSLKNKRWTAADVRRFIARMDDTLKRMDISTMHTSVNLRDDSQFDSETRAALHKYKGDQSSTGQNHDLWAVRKVNESRGTQARRVEEARTLFLTSDHRLARYCIVEGKHESRGTVPEVILDRVLTNILWLKKPNVIKSIQLHSIISLHSRQLFIDRRVWECFYETVQRLRSEGTVDDRDIALLLYDQRVQDMLREYSEEDVAKIKPDWILETLENAKGLIEKEKQEALAIQKESLQSQAQKEKEELVSEQLNVLTEVKSLFEKQFENAEQRMTDRLVAALKKQKGLLLDESSKKAKRLVKTLKVMFVIGIGALLWLLVPKVMNPWQQMEWCTRIPSVIGMIASVLGVKWDPKKWWAGFENNLRERFFRRKLEQAHLEILEAELTRE